MHLQKSTSASAEGGVGETGRTGASAGGAAKGVGRGDQKEARIRTPTRGEGYSTQRLEKN